MKNSLLISLFIISLFFTSSLSGQQYNEFSSQLRFIQHMQSRGNLKETLFLLENLRPTGQAQLDSANFFTGWVLYGLKDLQTSSFYLQQVSAESPLYQKSIFFAAYNQSYLNQIDQAQHLLLSLDLEKDGALYAMRNFQFAGITLLERNVEDFRMFAGDFTGSFSFMQAEEDKLRAYALRIQQAPNRSPWIAGIMSTAVPGLGKIYAGKMAEGISGFLYVGAMMVTTWDFYNRFGARSPFFIASAAVTSIFYIGNIWGSAASVNRTQREFNYEIDQRILLDMHVPLRRLFP